MITNTIRLLSIIFIFIFSVTSCNKNDENGFTELGDLIVWFMIDDGTDGIDWIGNSNPQSVNLFWNKDGVQINTDNTFVREGESKLVVNSHPMWTIHDKKSYLNWDVVLQGSKFGVNKVEISPNTECFGTGSSGCDFNWNDVFENTKSKDISITKVCEGGQMSYGGSLYQLSYDGKEDVLVMYGYTSGSAGTSNWIEIWFNNYTRHDNGIDVCDYLENKFL